MAITAGETVRIRFEPDFTGFNKKADQEAKRVSSTLKSIELAVKPVLSKNFRAELMSLISNATTGIGAEIKIAPALVKGFKADLASSLAAATSGVDPTVDADVDFDRTKIAADAKLAVTGITPTVDADVDFDRTKIAAEYSALMASLPSGQSHLLGAAALGLGPLAAATVAAGAGFGFATVSASDFSKELSNLEGVASASEEQLDLLRQQALEARKGTIYSATEALAAQAELAKAGLEIEDILAGGLVGALALASAGGLQLEDAAVITSNALNTFNLSGEEASHVSDVLAASANKSAATIDDIALALQQAGLVANGLGVSFEEANGVLAAFAQNGLRGSDAGTSLKNALLRMSAPTEIAAETMAKLNLSFFDANGNFIGIAAAAEELKTKLAGLSDEQRNAALALIFGVDAIRSSNLLFQEGAAGINEWTNKVNDAGYATELAGTKLDNLQGDLQEFKKSLQTTFIEAGTDAESGLRPLVQSLTDLVTTAGPSLTTIIGPVSELISKMAGPLATAMIAFSPIIGSIVTTFTEIGEAAGPALIDSFTALGTAFADMFEAAGPGIADFLIVIADVIKDIAPALPPLGVAFSALASTLADILVPALETLAPILPVIAAGLLTLWVAGTGPVGIILALAAAAVVAYQKFEPFREAIDSMAKEAADKLIPKMKDLGDSLKEFWDAIHPAVEAALKFSAAISAIAFESIINGLGIVIDLFSGLFYIFSGDFSKGFDKFGDAAKGFIDGIKKTFGNVGKVLGFLGDKLVEWAKAGFDWLKDNLDDIMSETLFFFATLPVKIIYGIGWLGIHLVKWAWDGFMWLKDNLPGIVKDVIEWFIGLPGKILDKLGDFGGKLVEWGKAGFEWLKDNLPKITEKTLDWYSDLGKKILDKLGDFGGKLVEWATAAFKWLKDELPGIAKDTLDWFADLNWKIISAIGNLGVHLVVWAAKGFLWLVTNLPGLFLDTAFWFAGLPFRIISAIGDLGVKLVEWATSGFKSLVENLPMAAFSVYEWFRGLKDTIGEKLGDLGGKFVEWATSGFNWLVINLPIIAAGVFGWFVGLPALIISKLGDFGGKLVEWGKAGFEWLKDNLPIIATGVIDWFTGLPGKIVETIGDLSLTLFDAGQKLIGGLMSGLTTAGEFVTDIAKTIANGIIGFVNDHIIDNLNTLIGDVVEALPGLGRDDAPQIPNIPEFATGGLITTPTLGWIGEAGPELVLPLNDPARVAELLEQARKDGLLSGPVTSGVTLTTAVNKETLDSSAGIWAEWWQTQTNIVTTSTMMMVDKFTMMADSFDSTTQRMETAWTTAWASIVSVSILSAQNLSTQILTALTLSSELVISTVRGYATNLVAALNPILSATGATPVVLPFAKGGIEDHQAEIASGSRIRVWAEPETGGEAYIPLAKSKRPRSREIATETVARLGGVVQWFANGGVTGNTQGLHPEFLRRLGLFGLSVGQDYNVGSGYRSIEAQTRLYKRWMARVPGQAPAAPPGRSMHNYGLASDGPRWRSYRPERFGLVYPMSYEPWHIEPVEAKQWRAQAIADGSSGGWGEISKGKIVSAFNPLPQPPEIMGGLITETAKKFVDFTYEQANKYANKINFGAPAVDLPALADGGMVTRDGVYRLGEGNKPEVVLPITNRARTIDLLDEFVFDGKQQPQKAAVENIHINVQAPAAQSAETYAASLRNRVAPRLASAITKAMG
jgi:TP901 family phage tail tape measure protein